MPPELVAGRYRVEREVGRGGMGSVWLCRDERLDRSVALKQVGGLPGESSMHLARALREARHSAALSHPNVVTLYDAIEEGDHVWLVMEYVPSRTLDQIVRADGPLPPERAARIGAEVADGLVTAHAVGTVHRDVKPSNILVRDDDGRALIADFGIARTVGDEQLTRTGMVTGTPTYFAPELARGEEPSPASDVWALGASLYVAVEGRPPYADQGNALALLNVIAAEAPPAPERAGPLTEPILRMMALDPAARWSMARVSEELHAIGGGAVPPPVVGPPGDGTLRMPAAAAAPPTSEATAEQTAERRTPAPPDAAAPSGHRSAPWVLACLLLLVLTLAGGWWLSRDPDSDPGAVSGPETPAHQRTNRHPARTPTASTTPTPEPSTTASSPPSSSAGTDAAQPGTTAGSAADFVADYYSLLPEDTETGWDMLSPELQDRIGRGTYEGFWATIDDVEVGDVREDGDDAVLATITYVTDGRSEEETRRLVVTRTDRGYLISEDQGAV